MTQYTNMTKNDTRKTNCMCDRTHSPETINIQQITTLIFYDNTGWNSEKKFASNTKVRNIRQKLHNASVLVKCIVNSALHRTEASCGLRWMVSGTLLLLCTSIPSLHNWDWMSNSVWTTNHSPYRRRSHLYATGRCRRPAYWTAFRYFRLTPISLRDYR